MKRLAFILLPVAAPAFAHDGEVHGSPGWTLDPVLTLPLLLALGIFGIGAWRLWRRSDLGRPMLKRSIILFVSGWLVLTGAVVSPLHEGGERSFALHMVEHELIMLVATLLLAASRPGGVLAWGLPQGFVTASAARLGGLWRILAEPVTATVLQAAALIAWHLPVLFDAALEHRPVHILQHASFVLTSLLFWSAMLHVPRDRFGLSAACLFVTSLVGGGLGALMAVSTSPWYAPYAAMQLTGIGLEPAADQQLAGVIMWVPGGLVHAGAALIFLYRWLKAAEECHAATAQQ